MRHKIEDFKVKMMVRALEDGETGWVRSVDVEANTVYVDFPTSTGTDVLDMDPADLEPVEPKR